METKTHWKKLHNPDYLGAWDFQPKEEKILAISRVVTEMVPDQNGKKEECTVCYWQAGAKPMILNVTNSKAITKVAGSPYIEDWQGVKVQLFVTEVKAFGEIMDAVRIRSIAPVVKLPELNEQHPKWQAAVDAIRAKTSTVEAIQKHYTVSEQVKTILINLTKEETINA